MIPRISKLASKLFYEQNNLGFREEKLRKKKREKSSCDFRRRGSLYL